MNYARYENFNRMLSAIFEKSPFQEKKLKRQLAERDESYFQEAEKFVVDYIGYLAHLNIPFDYAIVAYLRLCFETMQAHIEFLKTGRYPFGSSSEALIAVYNNEEKMTAYMIGVAISQILWKAHYDMFCFFGQYIKDNCKQINSYFEIGPGHGLYLKRALSYLGADKKYSVVDISATSINITKSIMDYFYSKKININYYIKDMLELTLEDEYDFITMGEVLEHVNFPEKLLVKLKDFLTLHGRAFISAAINSPMIDHIYYFKNVDEIRNMIKMCGLEIEKDLVLPTEDLPMEVIVKKKITVNYCAIIKKVIAV